MKNKNLFTAVILSSILFMSCSDDDGNQQTVSEVKLFTSSNTSGMISITDLVPATPITQSYSVNSTDADGIHYYPSSDEIILASRSNNRLEAYGNVKQAMMDNSSNLSLSYSSTSDFNNAREIAVSGNTVIVTQDQATSNGNQNKLFVYEKSASGFTLQRTFDVDIKLWGIHFDGNTLYAIADLTSDLVAYNNFLSNSSGPLSPSKRVTIEGLVRTHGITYSSIENTMVLTDVAAATSDADGGVIVIKNFSSVFSSTANNGTIGLANQIRIYGPNSLLGNPVDVAYDNVNKMIYVAERANGGGRVLAFSVPMASGDYAPVMNRLEPGCAAVFLLRR
ncbi:MAG: hypothetical protein KDC50_04920 [Flavobacterium sp.]|nr:hypothetical protein [Flavobacterium sp.]